MHYNPRRGEKLPKINGIECYGWPRSSRQGWSIWSATTDGEED